MIQEAYKGYIYLLLTEFFPFDLWPKLSAKRAGNEL